MSITPAPTAAAWAAVPELIRVRGARMHNLRNVDLDLPRGQFVVLTGPSGSGKSSLAFDTIFAEGQRQFIETLSVNSRRYFEQLERPDVDLVDGLQPTICIDQRPGNPHPRSTVATVTEIYDYLRVVMARLGQPYCLRCGVPIRQQTLRQIEDWITALPAGTKLLLLAPLVRGQPGAHADVFARIRKAGLLRVRIDGELHEIDQVPRLAPDQPHQIDAVIDRIVLRPATQTRLAESLQLAVKQSEGLVVACYWQENAEQPGRWRDEFFSTLYACSECGLHLEQIEPRSFSFHSPYGACPDCRGLGEREQVGSEASNPDHRPAVCQACGGSRLRPEANHVRFRGLAIHEITRLNVTAASRFFEQLQFSERERAVADPLIREIRRRLGFLTQVGVAYLNLDRAADSLSGGELQRVRLATSIGSGLVGVCYVLDEPSIGLHPRDNQRIIDALRDLQQQGNSVLVVEHDEAMMRQADWLVDVGPGAGRHGGRIVAAGSPSELMANPLSPTGRCLSGEERIPIPAARRAVVKSRSIQLEGAAANNLKAVSVDFPLGCLTCITGVSGSGKSTLINDTLAPALVRKLGGQAPQPGTLTSLRGVSQINKVVIVDQAPIGRTPRSNPATYSGVFDEIRKIFASTRDAKQRGFRASRFSFNAKGGRCEECLGHGLKKIELNFLPDLYVTCNACRGARFNGATLAVKFKGRSIAEVLDMPVEAAASFFENVASIHRVLRSLEDVGLGYLPLGQPSTTLSGGEAQRVKLATELARVDTGRTVYLLDEPTTGLHFHDIRRLLEVLQRLVDQGNTVIVIEHHLDLIKCADWIIDLGPEGGDQGGKIVAEGTPEEVVKQTESHTGRFLSAVFQTPTARGVSEGGMVKVLCAGTGRQHSSPLAASTPAPADLSKRDSDAAGST